MNSNVINVRKNFHFNYPSQIIRVKNLLPVPIAKVKALREFFQVLLQLHQKRADLVKGFI